MAKYEVLVQPGGYVKQKRADIIVADESANLVRRTYAENLDYKDALHVVDLLNADAKMNAVHEGSVLEVTRFALTPVAPSYNSITGLISVHVPDDANYKMVLKGEVITNIEWDDVIVPEGQTVVVTAIPREGYRFVDGVVTSWEFRRA